MKRLAILLVCAAFFCCGDDDDPTGPNQGGEIYPMAIGNTWTYEVVDFDTSGIEESRDTIWTTVVRDTVIEGETWYVTESLDDEDGIHLSYCTSRSDGFWADWPEEQLYYKYPANVGDRYMVDEDTVVVESLSESVTVPAGQFNCVRYNVRDNMFPLSTNSWLSPEVGLVSDRGLSTESRWRDIYAAPHKIDFVFAAIDTGDRKITNRGSRHRSPVSFWPGRLTIYLP